MPITDVPPQTPETEEPRQRKAHRGRVARLGVYDDLGGYDLLHVIEDLEDERARVQLREKIWIALILHLLVFGFLWLAPKYIWVTKVREAPLNQKQDLTVLTLPPDALKELQQARPVPRRSTIPAPQPKALRAPAPRTAPPAPRPETRPVPRPQQPAPPQVAHVQAPPAPQPKTAPPPIPHSETSQLNAPKPQPNLASSAPSLSQSMQQAERQSGAYGGESGATAPSRPESGGGAQILSDTMGVDFSKYIQRVVYDTKRAWYPIIPEVARPPISKQGRVLVRFKIMPDGTVRGMTLEGPSGDVSLDRAAWGGILGAQPFPPLPKAFKGPFLELRFYFLYNDTGAQ